MHVFHFVDDIGLFEWVSWLKEKKRKHAEKVKANMFMWVNVFFFCVDKKRPETRNVQHFIEDDSVTGTECLYIGKRDVLWA